jgi:hypothetical protein
LQDLQGFVPPRQDRSLVAPDGLRGSAFAIHKVRILPEQLVHAVAGQINEGLVGNNDRITGQRRVGHEHRHAGPPNSLYEHTTLLADRFDVALRHGPFRGVRLVLLKSFMSNPV